MTNENMQADPYEIRIGKHTLEHRHNGSRWHWVQDNHPTNEHMGLDEPKEIESAYGKFGDKVGDFKVEVKGEMVPASAVFPPEALPLTFRVYGRRLMGETGKALRRKLFQTIAPGSRGGPTMAAPATEPVAEKQVITENDVAPVPASIG